MQSAMAAKEKAMCQTTARSDNTGEQITMRDWQAMFNFYEEGICEETLAEYFICSVEDVCEVINTRPWLRPTGNPTADLTWMESDHSDTLELVKLYYPEQLPDGAPLKVSAKKRQYAMGWKEYLDTVDWDEAYECYGDRAAEVIMETAKEIALQSNIELTFK